MGSAAGAGAEELVPWPLPWESDEGVFFSRVEDVDGSERVRAAGPFFEYASATNGTELLAPLRPLGSVAVDPIGERTNWDVCWPIADGKTFGNEVSWRVGTAYYLDKDTTDETTKAERFWILPFWASGKTAEGEPYAAVFPLGGTVHDFLWRDRISFALWPLWMETEVNGLHSTNVLWPVYQRASSEDGKWDKLRVFPFYSRMTNKRQFEKKYVMWPFWNQAEYTHPKATGKAWVLFPVCGRVDLNSQKGWMVLPPLFQYVEGEEMSRLYCPWPFFQRETGEYRQRLYVWPFWGTRTDGELQRTFWAWPFVSREQNHWGRTMRVRWTFTPFYNRVTTSLPADAPEGAAADPDPTNKPALFANLRKPEPPPPGPRRTVATRTKVWPLWSHASDLAAGECRWRTLDLWPGPTPAPVERSWAPLWTLADYRSKGGNAALDVLWGLYRQRREADGSRSFSAFPVWAHNRSEPRGERHWSLLKGLVAWDRTPKQRRLRFLWLGRWSFGTPETGTAASD